ncbi:MAG: DNA recombination protein RmuC [Candidatus Binatia bacterium]
MDFVHLIVPLVIFVAGSIVLGWFFLSRLRTLLQGKSEDQSLLLMQQQIDQLRSQLSSTLDNNSRSLQQQLGQMIAQVNERLKENAQVLNDTQQSLGERLDNAARVVGGVQKSLGGLEEANRRIYEVGKDISSLQEILRAPKLRGGLGEFFLEDLLGQILPPQHFSIQHGFRSGEKVDAVIKLGASLVPVDAKFPLENFRRLLEATSDDERGRVKRQFAADVRKHIDAIAAKYILPDEGTYDFALMYIPAENVYYETVIKDETADERNLCQYAMSKRVIPVSPNSFYAYLQAIVLGLKGMRIDDRTKEIIQYLGRLQGDFAKFRDDFAVLGKHINHAQSSYQSADKRLEQFGQKFLAAESAQSELSEAGTTGAKTD